MVISTGILVILVHFGVSVAETLLVVATGSIIAALIAWRLHKACQAHEASR
jgi:hypothetical protein